MSLEVEHAVGLGVLVVLDEAVDEEPEGFVDEGSEVASSEGELEVEVAIEEPLVAVSAEAPAGGATADLECTFMTFLAMRAPTTAPAIARTATIPAIQNPVFLH
jgi:hypothetical protein